VSDLPSPHKIYSRNNDGTRLRTRSVLLSDAELGLWDALRSDV